MGRPWTNIESAILKVLILNFHRDYLSGHEQEHGQLVDLNSSRSHEEQQHFHSVRRAGQSWQEERRCSPPPSGMVANILSPEGLQGFREATSPPSQLTHSVA